MAMTEPQGRYSSYLLRLWQTASGGELVCRASLENARTGERVGFANLDDLFDYLRAQAGLVLEAERDANGSQEGRRLERR
jgi:hypothetical protein